MIMEPGAAPRKVWDRKQDAVAFDRTSITIADIRMPDGASLEKLGVEPDEAGRVFK